MLSQFHAFSNLSCIHSWIVPSSHINPYPIAPYQPCQGVAKTWGGGVSSIIVPLLLQLVFVAPSSIPQVNLIRVGWWSFQTGPNSRHSTVCQHFVSIHFREDWRCFIYSFERTTMEHDYNQEQPKSSKKVHPLWIKIYMKYVCILSVQLNEKQTADVLWEMKRGRRNAKLTQVKLNPQVKQNL